MMSDLIPASTMQLTALAALLALVAAGFFIAGVTFANAENRKRSAQMPSYHDPTPVLAASRISSQPPPAVVHVHMPAMYQGWPQPPVLDVRPILALEGQDRDEFGRDRT